MTERTRDRQRRPAHPNGGRRAVMRWLIGPLALAVPIAARAGRHQGATGAARIIQQPPQAAPSHFMARARHMRALAFAAGDQGYGAVIVKDGRIVGQAPSRVVVDGDPTAHAEMEAIRDAARNLGTRDLDGCIMYGTSRACPMCEAAATWANIADMRFGTAISPAGPPQLRRC